MSKEAKIGLLLGLLLIVGIALVLRGLHRQDEPMVEKELSITRQDTRPESPDPVSDIDIPRAVDRLSEGPYAAGPSSRTPAPSGSYDATVRHIQEIPGPGLPPQTAQPVIPPSIDPLEATLDQITEPVYSLDPLRAQAAGAAPQGAGNSGLDLTALDSPGRADSAGPANRIYVVESNDNLTKIALRVYGAQEGRKFGNIKRIFEANRPMLKSMDDVYAGQKLVIPRLAGQQVASSTGPSARSSTGATTGGAAATGRVYVVRDHDTLWDIAEAQLGSGIRYKEIAALNQIKEEQTIHAGMTLRLPSRD